LGQPTDVPAGSARRRGRATRFLTAAVLCGALLAPGVAQADRTPTARETRAIVRAAHAQAAKTQFVKVSDVRVSTAGPWAAATVALYHRSTPSTPQMTTDDLFVHTRGRWVDTAVDGKSREPPDRVLADLGFDTGDGSPSTVLVVIVAVVLAAIAGGFLLLVFGGLGMLFGSSGGGTTSGSAGGAAPRGGPVRTTPKPTEFEPAWRTHTPTETPCGRCGGSGREPPGGCGRCHGSGWYDNPYARPDGPSILPCDCGNRVCTGCGGRGRVSS
jgi:hypothetical protein